MKPEEIRGEKYLSDAISVPVMTAADPQGSGRRRSVAAATSLQWLPAVDGDPAELGNDNVCTAAALRPRLTNYATTFGCREVAEWLKKPDSKSGGRSSKIASVFLEMGWSV